MPTKSGLGLLGIGEVKFRRGYAVTDSNRSINPTGIYAPRQSALVEVIHGKAVSRTEP